MKTKTLIAAAFAFISTSAINSIFAQEVAYNQSAYDVYVSAAIPELKIPDSTIETSVNADAILNDKVKRSFGSLFKNASSQGWSMVGENFHCTFKQDNLLTRALFNKKGGLVYTVTYGDGNYLPADLSNHVKDNYPNHTILSAIHVNEKERDIWVVSLEYQNIVSVVRIENDEIEEVKKYIKY